VVLTSPEILELNTFLLGGKKLAKHISGLAALQNGLINRQKDRNSVG
jgi:hypothetical protein